MTSFSDRIKGATDTVVGKAKQRYGKATNNPRLQADGLAQHLKGRAETVKARVKDGISKF